MKITDEMLYEYVPKASELWMEEILKEAEDYEDHVFSKRFERKMNRLIRNQKRTPRMRKVVKCAKIASVAAAVVLVMLGLFVVPVNAKGQTFIEILSDTGSNSSEYRFSGNGSYEWTISDISLGYLPERMVEIENNFDANLETLTLYYENSDSNNEYLYITIDLIDKDSAMTMGINTKDSIVETIQLSGNDATLVDRKDNITLFWIDEHYLIKISGYVTKEEAIKIANNLVITKE